MNISNFFIWNLRHVMPTQNHCLFYILCLLLEIRKMFLMVYVSIKDKSQKWGKSKHWWTSFELLTQAYERFKSLIATFIRQDTFINHLPCLVRYLITIFMIDWHQKYQKNLVIMSTVCFWLLCCFWLWWIMNENNEK